MSSMPQPSGPASGEATTEILLLLAPAAGDAVEAVRERIESAGGRLVQSYGVRVCVVELPETKIAHFAQEPLIQRAFQGAVPDDHGLPLDETARLGVAAWNERHGAAFRRAKRTRVGEGLPWDHPSFEREE